MNAAGPKKDIDKYRGIFDECISKCASTHIDLIPSMFKRMTEAIKSGSYN